MWTLFSSNAIYFFALACFVLEIDLILACTLCNICLVFLLINYACCKLVKFTSIIMPNLIFVIRLIFNLFWTTNIIFSRKFNLNSNLCFRSNSLETLLVKDGIKTVNGSVIDWYNPIAQVQFHHLSKNQRTC